MLKPEFISAVVVAEDRAFEADFEKDKGYLLQSRNYVNQFLIL